MRGAIMLNRYPLVLGIWVLLVFFCNTPLWAVTRLDAAFGLNGRVAVELGVKNSGHAVVVQPDRKIVVAGSSSKGNAFNFSLLRFNKNGSLDSTFNGDGSVITSLSVGDDEALALGLLSDDRIIAAGYSHNGKDRDLALVCYRPDGSLDKSFGDAGVVLTSIGNGNEEITALTISPSDMITVVGSTEGTAGRVLVTARFFASGEPDTTYGEEGVSLIGVGKDASAEGIVERQDGTYVVSGSYEENKKSSAMLVGLNGDGTVDAGFGDKGVAIPAGNFAASEGYGLATDDDGMIYVAGAVGIPGVRDTALFRFTRNGKADSAFGDQGVVVTTISKEDDVLYDVDAGKSGVTASGFTTDAGTRQFLLSSYSQDAAAAEATASIRGVSAGNEGAASDLPPVQEVRVNGKSKVQIRRLQVWSNEVQIRELQLSGGSFDNSRVWQAPQILAPTKNDPGLGRLLSHGSQQIGDFFLPTSHAMEGLWPETEAGTFSSRSITTTFSEGEAVSYAVTSDEEGNIIVVGTADGNDASSIVAARFVAEDLVDRITNKPGHRSSHIATTVPADVTRTTMVTGGEIADSFDKEVVGRGVVFSVQPGPVYTGKGTVGGKGISAVPTGKIDLLASFFLPEAVAANPSGPQGANTASTNNNVLEQFISEGETENGTGVGGYTTLMESLLPGTLYYIRAYALTAKGEVYYGNQVSVRTADACFIATASFGTLLHPCVGILRDFRDAFLVNHSAGRWLVDRYYTLSPPLADFIAGNAVLRFVVRALLLPFIGFSWLALQTGLDMTLFLVAGAMVFLGWVVGRSRQPLSLGE
jgi:uncharacterized delta-60 repeat protein